METNLSLVHNLHSASSILCHIAELSSKHGGACNSVSATLQKHLLLLLLLKRKMVSREKIVELRSKGVETTAG
jgi:hypothetical protein